MAPISQYGAGPEKPGCAQILPYPSFFLYLTYDDLWCSDQRQVASIPGLPGQDLDTWWPLSWAPSWVVGLAGGAVSASVCGCV